MTHSGGKPHSNVGDRGQRYEGCASGYPKAEQTVIGWSEGIEGAETMGRRHPSRARPHQH
jgi:hypothetical protein